MVIDESGDLKNIELKDGDDLFESFKLDNNEFDDTGVEVNLQSDVSYPSQYEKGKEDDQPTMEPGPSNGTSIEETHPPKNDDFEDEEEQMDQP